MIFIKPINFVNEHDEKVVIELWHIDMFEGGTGSRFSLLKELARKYQKENNVVVVVKNYSKYALKENFKKGIYPHLISYSSGIDLPYYNLKKLGDGKGLGSYKGEIFAYPWCGGGYVYITRKNEKTDGAIISLQENTFPYLACYFSNLKVNVKEEKPSGEAIYSFYRNKNYGLVGTQRDLYRLNNKGIDVDVKVLDGYNDLYQFISILTDKNYSECHSFVSWLTNNTLNSDILKKIGMLTQNGFINNLSDDILLPYKGIKFKYTTNIFTSEDNLKKLKYLSLNCEKNIESIKNFVNLIDIK